MLEEYKKKRDFSLTPEPPARVAASKGALTFVIQKHDARRLHYDFRLEVNGILASWAVPKGPSYNPSDKRLAVQTEDHPLEYASFEGIIPAGEYGGGPVIVWDNGSYSPEKDGKTFFDDRATAEKLVLEGIKKGKLSIQMRGQRLRGSWTLVRLRDKPKDWMLIKHKDEFSSSGLDIVKEDRSIVTGRTIPEVLEGKAPSKPLLKPKELKGAKTARFPSFYEPMLANLADEPFSVEGWFYEPKMDGIRVVALLNGKTVRLLSRRGVDITAQYPTIVNELTPYLDKKLILDGEIVALNERGIPSFQLLQQRSGLSRAPDIKAADKNVPAFYYLFDLLHLDGKNLEDVILADRKSLLKQIIVPSDHIRLVESFTQDGVLAFEACVKSGLEGIVAKRLDSLYVPGKRSRSWLKVKGTLSSEFLICGYTEGTGTRTKTFGSLVVGYHDNNGVLVYAGGVGTGFNEKSLAALAKKMKPLETDNNPFGKKIPGKKPQWLKPKLVAEIKFAEWTKEGILRSPVFLHLREDIKPEAVTRSPVIDSDTAEPVKMTKNQPKKKSAAAAEKKERVKSKRPPENSGHIIEMQGTRQRTKKSNKANYQVNQDVLYQLSGSEKKLTVEVDGYEVAFTNLDKPFWPEHGDSPAYTKRDLAIYFTKVAPYLLPHMKGRPLTLVRFPNGIKGGKFYQKHWEHKLPPFVSTVEHYSEQYKGDEEYMICDNLATLLWLAQIADLELHTWQARVNQEPDAFNLPTDATGTVAKLESSILNYPDFLLFDLDPYIYSGKEAKGDEPELNMAAFRKTCDLANWLREMLEPLDINIYLKTTGRTGLHMYIPLIRNLTFDEVRALSEAIGKIVMAKHREDVTMDWAVVKRTGKVFLDHNMNARGKTLASIYSPRVAPEASVSVPVRWEELYDIYPTDFTISTVHERLAKVGDLWADILDKKNDVRAVFEKTTDGKPARRSSRGKV